MNLNKHFSITWKRSTQPRKQRKYRLHAPLHIKQKFLHTHLSPELRKKYGARNIQIRVQDKIKILRGQFKGQEGKVSKVNLKKETIFVGGLEKIKKDGTKMSVTFHPSNLMITELHLDDKKRKQKLETKRTSSPKKETPTKKTTEEKK